MLMKMEPTKGKRVDPSLPIRLRNRRFPHLQEAISQTLQKSNQPQPMLLTEKKVKPIRHQWISMREETRMMNGSSRSINPRRVSNSTNNSLRMRNRKLIRIPVKISQSTNNQRRSSKRLSLVTHHVSGSWNGKRPFSLATSRAAFNTLTTRRWAIQNARSSMLVPLLTRSWT